MMPEEFEFIAARVRERSGLVLRPEQAYLLDNRLTPIARRMGHASLSGFIGALRQDPREDTLCMVAEALTTNETSFFRDRAPFERFKDCMLPRLAAARSEGEPLKVWCAAASYGQEPYSLSMLLSEHPESAGGHPVEIVATDLSRKVLERARAGIYNQFEAQRGLPIQFLVKYFTREDDQWRVASSVRSRVTFQECNLLDDLRGLSSFDIVFCRNVLFYFDRPTKKAVVEKIKDHLAADGYLVIGATETLNGITDLFLPVDDAKGLYRLAASQGEAGETGAVAKTAG